MTTKEPHQSISLWLHQAHQRQNACAFKFKSNSGNWIEKTYAEYLKYIVNFQQLLKSKHIKPQDKVALMSQTRWEWSIIDVATVSMRSILVPLYPNLTDEDVQYILEHCEAKIIFVDNKKTFSQAQRVNEKLVSKIEIVLIEEIHWNTEGYTDDDIYNLIQECELLKAEDPVTIIYTSGTTGKPKGVLLQHQALVSEVHEAFSLFTIYPHDCSLAFLPYAHVMGRIEHWGCMYSGCQVAYAESIEKLKNNLKEISPTFLVAVPRIFEKIYSGILTQVELSPIKKRMFDKTLQLAKQIQYYRETFQTPPLTVLLAFEALDKIVFSAIKKAFGGKLRFAISGGAPLSADLGQFFSYIGIRIFEGYGLTETFAAITVNTESQWKVGTVGKPIGDVEIKFASDGEILVRSKKCLKEYYKNPEATEQSIDKDGFFATGDIGEFTTDGYLKITDRKKDLIKTAGGKYVAPQKLESLLKQEPLISQVLICGDQQKYITAIITCESITNSSTPEEQQKAIKKINAHLLQINSQLASYESIKRIEILFEIWTVENGFLTPSMKVKRNVITKKYADIINKLYLN